VKVDPDRYIFHGCTAVPEDRREAKKKHEKNRINLVLGRGIPSQQVCIGGILEGSQYLISLLCHQTSLVSQLLQDFLGLFREFINLTSNFRDLAIREILQVEIEIVARRL
jgi:hypothetical protein